MKLLSRNGLSLVETLVGLGLLASATTAMMKFSTNNQKTIKHTMNHSQMDRIVSDITNILSDPDNCKETLGGLEPRNTTDATRRIRYKNNAGNFVDRYTAGNQIGVGKLVISDFSLSESDANVSVTNFDNTHLVLTFEKANKFTKADVIKKIEVSVVLSDTNMIESCRGVAQGFSGFWAVSKANVNDILYMAGNIGVGTATPTATLDVGSGMAKAGQFVTPSDYYLKHLFAPIDGPLKKINLLEGKEYSYISNDRRSYGVVAQQVQKVFPYAVHEGSDGYLSVDYQALIAPLIESVKELSKKVDGQQLLIKELKSKINKLEMKKSN